MTAPPRSSRLWVVMALIAPLASSPASAAPSKRARAESAVLEDSQQKAGYIWQAAAVLHPIEVPPSGVPAELTRLPAPKPGVRSPQPQGPTVRGAVEVGPGRAAMVRLEALGVARVRLVGGPRERLRFHRVSGEGGTAWAAALEGPIELTPGTWLLEQPPGGPSYWLITAPRSSQIVVETAAPRTGDLIWEHAIGAVLTWIDEGGDAPQLPAVVGAEEARRELEADAQISAEIERLDDRDPALRRAVTAWRQATAIQQIEALRRPIRPAFALELGHRALAGATWLAGLIGWQRVRGAKTVVWSLTGPGVLWIEARSVGTASEGSITVHAAGRRLGHAALLRPVAEQREDPQGDLAPETDEQPTPEPAGPDAKPETPASFGGGRGGEDIDLGARAADGAGPDHRIAPRLATAVNAPVGPRAALRIPLAPGKHDYTIVLDNTDTVALLRVGRRNERLAGLLRGEGVAGLLRRGHRDLAESTSPRAPLVRALYAALEAAPAPALAGDPGSPVLALAQTWLAAQQHGLDRKQRIALARKVARQVAKRGPEPMVWRARRVALDLLEGTGEAGLARVLVGPRAAEAPTELLERLARQIGGPALAVRSPAVALLELARRRAPLDMRLRAAYRDHWRAGTRWASLRADEAAGAPWTWIEPWSPADDRVPGTRSLWRWPNGEPRALAATVSGAMPGRSALLRMYVQMPAAAPVGAAPVAGSSVQGPGLDARRDAALSLAIGESTWHGVALSAMESWRVALPPGQHTVRMTGPAGAILWSSQPPTTGGPPQGHLLRMWPAVGGAQIRFLLPAGIEPGFVRIEARAIADPDGPQRARIYVARDDGPERAVDLWLPPADPEIVPIDAAHGVGPRASVIIGIGPDTRAVWIRVADNAPRLAIAASIRSTRETELGATARAEDAALLAAVVPAPGDESPLDRLARVSRAIRESPDDLGLRLARAELLLDLDQPGYAFVDWRLVTGGRLSRALAARATALAERLDALDAPDSLDLTTDVPVLVAPALAAAVGPALARLDKVAPALAAAREGGPSMGLRALDRLALDDETRWRAVGGPGGANAPADRSGPKDRSVGTAPSAPGDRPAGTKPTPGKPGKPIKPVSGDMSPETDVPVLIGRPDPSRVSEAVGELMVASVLRATWLDAQARPAEAARVWARVEARTGLWQAGLNGVRSFLNVLDLETPAGVMPPPPQSDGAALAYGLALSVRRTLRTPAIQRLATVAATRSRWSRVEGSEQDAGHESLKVPRAPALPSPNAAVRQALMVPPWDPVDATLLRPGYATVLDLKRAVPGTLGVDLWCQTVRPDLGEGGLPRVRVVLDGATLFDEPIVVEKVSGTAVEALPAGPHRLEVALDASSRAQLCSVRLRDDAGALATLRPTRWRVARAKQPAEVVVLGPTTLAVEARALLGPGAPPQVVQVSVAQGEGPFAPRGSVPLQPEPDPRATPEPGRTITAGPARTEVISLPEPGPQRVLLRPQSGAVLVRLQQRLDAEPTPVPRPPIRALDLGGLVDPIASIGLPRTDVPPVASPPQPQRFGTVWSEVRGGRDDIEDNDDLALRNQVRVRVGYARELMARRMWLGVTPELRWRDQTNLAGGGALALQTVFPAAGLRTRLSAAALAQDYSGGPAWMAEGALYIDRLTWIAPRWQVVPSLDLRYRHQSLAPADVMTAMQPVNPRIFTRYSADHPFVLRPGVELRYQPLQDLRLFVAADLTPNSDFRGLDHANFRGGLLGVMALLRRVVPEFALAYEGSLRLKDADRSDTYLQSRMHAGLGLGVWAGQAARVVFGVGDTLYVSAPYPIRNVFEAWLRVDLVFGRALRDYGPMDMSFRPVREHRLWTGEGGAR